MFVGWLLLPRFALERIARNSTTVLVENWRLKVKVRCTEVGMFVGWQFFIFYFLFFIIYLFIIYYFLLFIYYLFFILRRMGKNNAQAPTLPRIRYMCFDLTHAPVATAIISTFLS